MRETQEDSKGLMKRLLSLNSKAKEFLNSKTDWYLEVNEKKKVYVFYNSRGKAQYSSEDLKSWTDPEEDQFLAFTDYGRNHYTPERMTAMEIFKDLLTFECKVFRGPYVKRMYGDRIRFID